MSEANLNKVTIYRFRLYDITADEPHTSRRWATLEAIERIHGEVLEDTATEVDAAVVSSDIPGMTERSFNPHPRVGFQKIVTT
jgi:hypothetical protein